MLLAGHEGHSGLAADGGDGGAGTYWPDTAPDLVLEALICEKMVHTPTLAGLGSPRRITDTLTLAAEPGTNVQPNSWKRKRERKKKEEKRKKKKTKMRKICRCADGHFIQALIR